MTGNVLDMLTAELRRRQEVSAWRIRTVDLEARELFFIRRELDMSRGKAVRRLLLTVYHDYSAEGRDWRGAAEVRLHPSSDRREVSAAVERALGAAALVRNRPHPLPAGSAAVKPAVRQGRGLGSGDLASYQDPVSRAVFAEDRLDGGGLNSCEIFLERGQVRILNSEGVDVRFDRSRVLIELIADWQAPGWEEVELYRELRSDEVDENEIRREVSELLRHTRDRAQAKPLGARAARTAQAVLLGGEAVAEFFKYYLAQSAAENVYRGISSLEVGHSLTGSKQKRGLTVRLLPDLPGSSASSPYDADGTALRPVTLFEEGILRRYWGPLRFCYYLGCEPTGSLPDMEVEAAAGSCGAAELRGVPHLEIVSFSDFQCDPLTGDFGGEIRLAYLGRGDERLPVTGGSMSGNVLQVEEAMTVSSEQASRDNFRGPLLLSLEGVSVTPASG